MYEDTDFSDSEVCPVQTTKTSESVAWKMPTVTEFQRIPTKSGTGRACGMSGLALLQGLPRARAGEPEEATTETEKDGPF